MIAESPFRRRLVLSAILFALGALVLVVPNTWIRAAGAFMMAAALSRYPPISPRVKSRRQGALLRAFRRKPWQKTILAALGLNSMIGAALLFKHADHLNMRGFDPWLAYFATSLAAVMAAVVLLRWTEESEPDAEP